MRSVVVSSYSQRRAARRAGSCCSFLGGRKERDQRHRLVVPGETLVQEKCHDRARTYVNDTSHELRRHSPAR